MFSFITGLIKISWLFNSINDTLYRFYHFGRMLAQLAPLSTNVSGSMHLVIFLSISLTAPVAQRVEAGSKGESSASRLQSVVMISFRLSNARCIPVKYVLNSSA